MNSQFKIIVWQQFGAAIDMLENAIIACPEEVWGNRIEFSEFWYISFHTLFFLDLYLSESDKGFTPPAPFNLDELDERGKTTPLFSPLGNGGRVYFLYQ